MHVLNMTPLARAHAEKLAEEDRIKARAAQQTRLRNIEAWKNRGLRIDGLSHLKPGSTERSAPKKPRKYNHEARKRKREDNLQLVLQRLQLFSRPAKCREIAESCNLEDRATCTYLHMLCHRGLIEAVYAPHEIKGRHDRRVGFQLKRTEEE